MSHFVVLALVEKNEADVEGTIDTLLAPYGEEVEVPEHDTDCYCVNMEASGYARTEIEKELPIEKLREAFQEQVKAVCLKYGQDYSKYQPNFFGLGNGDERVDAETDKLWEVMLAPRRKREEEIEKAHKKYMKPKKGCEQCKGKGKYKTTSNPDGHWDWYEIGGRWADYLPNDKDRIPVQELIDSKQKNWFPFAVVAPDGKWYQHGRMGWFGCSSDEMSETDWATEIMKIMKAYPNHLAVTVDCHV